MESFKDMEAYKEWELKRRGSKEQIEDDTKNALLWIVGAAWHELAPSMVRHAKESKMPLLVWQETQRLLLSALEVPPADHSCDRITCKYGYAHEAGF